MKISKKNAILIKNILYPLLGILIFFVIWAIAAAAYGFKLVLPSPASALKSIGKVLASREFWRSVLNSFLRTLLALGLSYFCALVCALLSKNFSGFKKVCAPIIAIIRAVPTMVVAILFLLWFSAGFVPVLVAFLVLFPTLYSSFLLSAEGVSKDLIDAATIFGSGKLQSVWFITLPSIKRALIENAAGGFSLSFKIVVSAEILAYTADSIGVFMQSLRGEFQYSKLLASALIVCCFCIIAEYSARIFLKE